MNGTGGAALALVAAGETGGAREGDLTPEYSDDLFSEFWVLYPRHESRKKARKVWDRMDSAQRLAATIAALDWRQVWRRQNRSLEVIPYAASWLNGECWEDELPEWYKPTVTTVVPINGAEAPKYVKGEIPDYVREAIAKFKRSR